MSRKSERLVNLTIALLNTKRYLTKSEIFTKVSGYEGSAESKERMFERDKDELRAIGIAIEVQQIDPFFGDEAGYRIRSEDYGLNLGPIDSYDVSLMSVALSLLRIENQELLIKLRGLQAEAELPLEEPLTPLQLPETAKVVAAIEARTRISFQYLNSDDVEETRQVEPYGVYSRLGYWYMVGRDLLRNELRTFRFDRISNEIVLGQRGTYELPDDFQLQNHIETTPSKRAIVRARSGYARDLRARATSIEGRGEWDLLTIPYFSETWLLEKVLWHLDSAIVVEPVALREQAEKALAKIVALHE